MNALTPDAIQRLAAEIKADRVRASATGDNAKLGYIMYNEDGTPNYKLTLAVALATIPGISELNRARILAIYSTSSAGGYDDLVQQMNNIQNQINNIETEINTIEAQLDGVDDAINDISNLKTQLAELRGLYSSLNNTVTELNNTVSNLEVIVDNLDISDLDARITSNKLAIDTIQADIVDLTGRVDKLEDAGGSSPTGGLDDRVKTLEATVESINATLEQYNTTIETIQYDIERLTLKVTNVESSISSLTSLVNNHETSISTLTASITAINSRIEDVNDRIDQIITGGEVDLTNYVTKSELSDNLATIASGLRGATIYNVHILGWHNDIELNFDPETYPDASDFNEYGEQYGMIVAKTINSIDELLAMTVDATTVAQYMSDIMYVDTIEELYNNLAAHASICSLGYGKPKVLDVRFDGTTIFMDTYFSLENGVFVRTHLSSAGVKFTPLLNVKKLTEKLAEHDQRLQTIESNISAMRADIDNNSSRISALGG